MGKSKAKQVKLFDREEKQVKTDKSMPIKVVGMDLSLTAAGVTVVDGTKITNDTVRFGVFKSSTKYDPATRLVVFYKNIFEFINDGCDTGVTIVYIEEPLFKKGNAASTRKMFELNMAFRFKMCEAGIPFVMPATQQMKKHATGNGRADKVDVIRALQSEYNVMVANDAEGDSLALAAMGLTTIHSMFGRTDINIGKSNMAKIRIELVKRIVSKFKDRVCNWEKLQEKF